MTYLLVILLCGVLNRVRGDDRWMREGWRETGAKRLPGRALFYAAPAVAAAALLVQPWPVALAFGVGYAFWAVWPWGVVLSALGGFAPDRAPSRLEAVLLKLPGRFLPAYARMLFALPCTAAVGWLLGDLSYLVMGAAFAAASTAAYSVFLRRPDAYDWMRSEIATGALWGLLILAPLVKP